MIWILSLSEHSAQKIIISQEFNIRAGETHQIIGELNDRIILYHEISGRSELIIFDTDLNMVRKFATEFEKNRVQIIGVNIHQETLNYFYFFRDKGSYTFIRRSYNPMLEEISRDTVWQVPETEVDSRFHIVESLDKSKIVLTTIRRQRDVIATCYDLKGDTVMWNTSLILNDRLKFNPLELVVTNDGSAYWINNMSPQSLRKQKFICEIIRMSPALIKPIKSLVDIADLNSEYMLVKYDEIHHRLIIAGLYVEDAHDRLMGTYALCLNPSDSQDRYFTKIAFDSALESEIIAEQRDRDPGIKNLIPRDIVLKDDGGFLLISEIQRVNQRYGGAAIESMRGPGGRNWIDYYFEDVVIRSFHPNAALEWEKILHKKQYSQDDDAAYSSFFLFLNNSAFHLFYNDEISLDNTVSKYSISPDGRSIRSSVMSTEYQRQKLRFNNAVQLSGTTLVIPSDCTGNRISLVKIAYDSMQ